MPTTEAVHRPAVAGERCEIGEISDPPIPLAAQTIKLAAQPPAARTRPELGGKMATIRRDDQIGAGLMPPASTSRR